MCTISVSFAPAGWVKTVYMDFFPLANGHMQQLLICREMSSMCCCRSHSKDQTERKSDDLGDEIEPVKSEKKVRKKMEEKRPAASAADTGVSGDTGEKRRRSRRLSIKEEMKDLHDDERKVSASVKDMADVMTTADSKGFAKEFPLKQETELDELKYVKDEVVFRLSIFIFFTLSSRFVCMWHSVRVSEYFLLVCGYCCIENSSNWSQ